MKRATIMAATIVGAAALGTAAGLTTKEQGGTERLDCPGKIVCPLTGELICVDQCPVGEAKTRSIAAEPEYCCCSPKDSGTR